MLDAIWDFSWAAGTMRTDRGGARWSRCHDDPGPIAATLIQMAISRSREFDADAAAAKYIGSPYGLISALQKLESWSQQIPMDASPATAHMFIIKPFTGQGYAQAVLHAPADEERIARLQAIR